MYGTPREFIDQIGGYRVVAERIGVSSKTMNAHANSKRLPSRWYVALCDLAKERELPTPKQNLFSFVPLPKVGKERCSDDAAI